MREPVSIVVGKEEHLVLPERAAKQSAELVHMLGWLQCGLRNPCNRILHCQAWRIKTPGIQSRVAEELKEGAMELVTSSLDGIGLNALSLIEGRVACGLDLKLIDRIH